MLKSYGNYCAAAAAHITALQLVLQMIMMLMQSDIV